MSRGWDDASDAQLLAACHAEAEPFAVFYRRHERLVAGWLMRRCDRVEVVGDLVAEVFAAAYLGAPRYRSGPEPAQAWLLGIARNKLLRSLRRERDRSVGPQAPGGGRYRTVRGERHGAARARTGRSDGAVGRSTGRPARSNQGASARGPGLPRAGCSSEHHSSRRSKAGQPRIEQPTQTPTR